MYQNVLDYARFDLGKNRVHSVTEFVVITIYKYSNTTKKIFPYCVEQTDFIVSVLYMPIISIH